MNFTLHRDYSILPVVIGVVLIVSAIHTITVLTTSMLHTFNILDFLAMLSINEPAGGFSDLFFYNISS